MIKYLKVNLPYNAINFMQGNLEMNSKTHRTKFIKIRVVFLQNLFTSYFNK